MKLSSFLECGGVRLGRSLKMPTKRALSSRRRKNSLPRDLLVRFGILQSPREESNEELPRSLHLQSLPSLEVTSTLKPMELSSENMDGSHVKESQKGELILPSRQGLTFWPTISS